MLTLEEFCDTLIEAEDAGDYGAKLTLDGMVHYLHSKQRDAISRPTLDAYKEYRKFTTAIYNKRRAKQLQRDLKRSA